MIELFGLAAILLVTLNPVSSLVHPFQSSSPSTSNSRQDSYFTQKVDHFDPHNSDTWQHRYLVNQDLWNKGGNRGPVFMVVEGEQEITTSWLNGGHPYEMAVKHNALIIVVEHRFYGKSAPFSSYNNQNIKFLSSEQAIADIAALTEFAIKKFGIAADQKIIIFGGSYAGNLAAWSRIKNPQLFYDAVASSAPVLTKVDFFEYDQIVSQGFANPAIGGSQDCAKQIEASFKEIDLAFASNDSAKITAIYSKYNFCPIEAPSEMDKSSLIFYLSYPLFSAVQYNRVTDVADQCKQIASPSPQSGPCNDASYAGYLALVNDDTVSPSSAYRQWFYQGCTELGYFFACETTDSGKCIFSSHLSLDFYLQTCKDAFGLSPAAIQKGIAHTNEYYGGNHTHGSRIVYVNGEIDPWHILGVQQDLDNDQTVVLISDGAHCQDMYRSSDSDSQPLKDARSKIAAKVDAWLGQSSTTIQ